MDRTQIGKSFPKTRWTLIAKIRDGGSEDSGAALSSLCRDYWLPLYSFLRFRGDTPEQAEDTVQGFFLEMLSKDGFSRVVPPEEEESGSGKGTLRSFLLACLKNYRSKVYRASTAQKRGGVEGAVVIDAEMAERRLADVSASGQDPEQAYDKAWALNLIRRATESVEEDYSKRGKSEIFRALEPLLGWNQNSGGETYAEIGARLGVNEQAVKTGVHRLRKRVRESIKSEIERTIDPEEGVTVEQELSSLFAVLG